MSIYRKKNSPFWHYDFLIRGHRFHGSTEETQRAKAKKVEDREREAAKIQVHLLETQQSTNKRRDVTLNHACGHYYETIAKHQTSWKTTDYQLENLGNGLGKDRMLSEIEQSDIFEYAARRRSQVSDASTNRETQLARRVWRHAYKKMKAKVSEIEWSELLYPESEERVRELSTEEERAIMACIREDYRDFFRFMKLMGPRQMEGVNLLWANVDFERMEAKSKSKGDKWHHFALTAGMVELIKRQPKVHLQVFTYICQKNRGSDQVKGKRYPITRSGLNRIWRNAREAAGLTDFRFHDLRHHAATQAMRKTGNLKLVKQMLGHTTITTTERYAHVSKADVRNALEDVERDANSRTFPEQGKGMAEND